MTTVRLHGILAKEYGDTFYFYLNNPKNTLDAIEANRNGFIKRFIELHKEGLSYDLIINKQRIEHAHQVDGFVEPETVDLVPAIVGSGLGSVISWIVQALVMAAISYALAPKPEVEGLELTAAGGKESMIFSNVANVATQGAALPVGYGRLKVGSQVVQATVKSYPQHQKTRNALRGPRGLGSSRTNDTYWITNKRTDQ